MSDGHIRRPGTLIAMALGVLVVIGVIVWAVFVRATPTAPEPVVSATPAPLVSASPVAPAAASPEPLTAATRRSEEHTYELKSIMRTSYAVFCLTQNTTRHD